VTTTAPLNTTPSSPAGIPGQGPDNDRTPPTPRRRIHRGQVIRHILLIAGGLVALFPFYWMIVLSTHDSSAIFEFPPKVLPGNQLSTNMHAVMGNINIWAAAANTFIVAVTITFFVLFFDSLAAFAFSKFHFPGRNILFMIVMATFLLPAQLATVPQFLMMTELHWVGDLKAVIVPSLANAFGIFWLRQYMSTSVKTELLEAARLDGCGYMRQYFHVALPSARPALAFLGMFTFIGGWNDFMWPLIVLNDPSKLTLQVSLSQLQTAHGTDYGMLMAGALIAVVPLVIVFVLGARQFINGIMDGATK
jgi:cellobiose transport system permease protein